MSNDYENLRTADIVAEALLDWKVDVISAHLVMA
jgi:hypothetical protein